VQYHVSDDYTYPWGWTRWYYYNPVYIPSTVHDGTVLRVGNQGYNGYLSIYNQCRAVPTDVTIELSGTHVSGQTYRFSAEVCVEPDGQGKTMRIYMVQVLDYWPAYGGYHRNGYKQGQNYMDITLAPGECQVVEHDFSFDADSWNAQEDITVVAWAQNTGTWPNSSEVYQAATIDWPFTAPCPGDLNDDGQVGQEDLGILLADWGCTGMACAADLDGDGSVGQQDLGILLADWGCGT
jgi:hypothetical protein